MRNLALFLSLIAILLLGGCSKGKRICCDIPEAGFFIHTEIADSVWSAPAEAQIYNDTLVIYGTKGDQHLSMSIRFNGTGSYPLVTGMGAFYSTIGGDVIGQYYHITNHTGNKLVITSYDRDKGILQGEFNTEVELEQRPNASTSVKMLLNNGRFRAQLPK